MVIVARHADMDGSAKAVDALLQLCAFGFGRQIGDQTLQHFQEFMHSITQVFQAQPLFYLL